MTVNLSRQQSRELAAQFQSSVPFKVEPDEPGCLSALFRRMQIIRDGAPYDLLVHFPRPLPKTVRPAAQPDWQQALFAVPLEDVIAALEWKRANARTVEGDTWNLKPSTSRCVHEDKPARDCPLCRWGQVFTMEGQDVSLEGVASTERRPTATSESDRPRCGLCNDSRWIYNTAEGTVPCALCTAREPMLPRSFPFPVFGPYGTGLQPDGCNCDKCKLRRAARRLGKPETPLSSVTTQNPSSTVRYFMVNSEAFNAFLESPLPSEAEFARRLKGSFVGRFETTSPHQSVHGKSFTLAELDAMSAKINQAAQEALRKRSATRPLCSDVIDELERLVETVRITKPNAEQTTTLIVAAARRIVEAASAKT